MSIKKISVFCLTFLVLSCSSKYKTVLHLYIDEADHKVKVETTEFIKNSRLSNPNDLEKVVVGENNTIILNLSSRGKRKEADISQLIAYDEFFRCRLYLQTDPEIKPGTSEAMGNSFVLILGRYNLTPEEKSYLPKSGSIVIDSLHKKHLYGHINAVYYNIKDDSLKFNGDFKVKYR